MDELYSDKLGLFYGEDKPDVVSGWKLYDDCLRFNDGINLNDIVRVNELFFVGKQWEGIQSNGSPTPVFNFLKQAVCFTVASITSDNIKVNATALQSTPNTGELTDPVRIVNDEFESIFERNNVTGLVREYGRNAAVDGDGCLYSYWDAEAETGQAAKGAIITEVLDNTDVYFGNPNDRRVQSQPYIIIERRLICRDARRIAKANGIATWQNIAPDGVNKNDIDVAKLTFDKVTDLLLLWRDDDTGEIWSYEYTHDSAIEEPKSLGIRLYPITWLNWDYIKDCYHGQAMITGLIHNQMFVNRLWAMTFRSMSTSAFSKYIYDATRIKKIDNRVGAAIPVNGGNVGDAIKTVDPAPISPQVSEYLQLAVTQTRESVGATNVALGLTRPDNTSAIISLQRAASTPSEITKQNLYQSIEDLCRIYLEFMAEYYGKRKVDIPIPDEVEQVYDFLKQQNPRAETPSEISLDFDFNTLKNLPMQIKLDVGASSYYSEIASIQTLDNLLQLGQIDIVEYLERVPDSYIPGRLALIRDLKQKQEQAAQMMAAQSAPSAATAGGEDGIVPEDPAKTPIPQGGGYQDLQRKINEGADVV